MGEQPTGNLTVVPKPVGIMRFPIERQAADARTRSGRFDRCTENTLDFQSTNGTWMKSSLKSMDEPVQVILTFVAAAVGRAFLYCRPLPRQDWSRPFRQTT